MLSNIKSIVYVGAILIKNNTLKTGGIASLDKDKGITSLDNDKGITSLDNDW